MIKLFATKFEMDGQQCFAQGTFCLGGSIDELRATIWIGEEQYISTVSTGDAFETRLREEIWKKVQ